VSLGPLGVRKERYLPHRGHLGRKHRYLLHEGHLACLWGHQAIEAYENSAIYSTGATSRAFGATGRTKILRVPAQGQWGYENTTVCRMGAFGATGRTKTPLFAAREPFAVKGDCALKTDEHAGVPFNDAFKETVLCHFTLCLLALLC